MTVDWLDKRRDKYVQNSDVNFMERLKKLMQDKKVTGYRLAKDLNISNSTLRNWLSGRAGAPRDSTMERLANYFGISRAWLKYGDEQYAPTIRADAMRIAEQIEQYLIQYPSQKNKIEAIIDVMTTSEAHPFKKKNIIKKEKLKK